VIPRLVMGSNTLMNLASLWPRLSGRRWRRGWLLPLALAFVMSSSGLALGAEHSSDEHGEAAHHGHAAPTLDDVNWTDGLFGGRDESTPVPFVALLINSAILFFVIVKLGGPKIAEGLVARRNRLAAEIDAAAAMHKEAEAQLAHYEAKLAKMEAEAKEMKRSMRESAERERQKTLEDARAQRDKLVREAEDRVQRELGARREAMIRDMVLGAVRSAETSIQKNLRDQDQTWFGERMLAEARSPGRGANS
jgi:F-type H+-transporting ATPase subunit b